MSKKIEKKSVSVQFRIVLEVGMDIGSMSLEDSLTKAKAMKVTDLIDLEHLDNNDSSIEVTGLFVS